MWIAHLGIGHKKLLFIAFLFTIALAIAIRFNPISAPLVITAATMFFGSVVYVAYNNGIFVRRFVFNVNNQRYEVRDYFSFSKPKDSYRAIVHHSSGGVESSIYLTKQNVWKYCDIVRHTLVKLSQPAAQNALVLGGGGGSVGYFLVRDGFIRRVNVVEKSKIMIDVAKHHFLPHPIPKGVRFVLQDALDYLQMSTRAYDFIFVDLFDGSTPSKLIARSDFVRLVKRSVEKRGVLIINLGYHGTYDLRDIISLYKSALGPFQVYVWNGSVIGIATKRALSNIIGIRII